MERRRSPFADDFGWVHVAARLVRPAPTGDAPWFEATEEPCHDSHAASWDPRNPSPVEDSGRSLGG